LVPLVDDDEESENFGELAEADDDRPWNGEGPTTHTVLYSDKTWKYEDIGSEDEGQIYHLDLGRVFEIAADEVDMEIDWIPVIHIPNSDVDSGERFGVSSLASVMQIHDDLVSTDTDLQASSATTGSPPLVIADPMLETDEDGSIRSYGPGEVIGTSGDSKGATLIDTSSALDALIKYDDKLLNRLSVNGRIPESLLGRVKPSEVPSGITLTLSFAPHSSMVRGMRLVRGDKYKLFLKMVGRFYMQDGQISEIVPARLHFGTFLPADKSETKELIRSLYEVKAISLETAVKMMMEAGFPIEDLAAEVKLIQESDFEGATQLMGVTADVNIARRYLGLPPITVEAQPEGPLQDEAEFPLDDGDEEDPV
jgi:hypothetical protein